MRKGKQEFWLVSRKKQTTIYGFRPTCAPVGVIYMEEICKQMEEQALRGNKLPGWNPLVVYSRAYYWLGREKEARAYMAEALKMNSGLSLTLRRITSIYGYCGAGYEIRGPARQKQGGSGNVHRISPTTRRCPGYHFLFQCGVFLFSVF